MQTCKKTESFFLLPYHPQQRKNSCCGSSVSKGIDLATLRHTALVISADALEEFTLCINLGKKCFQYICGESMGRGNRARLGPLALMFSEIHTDSSWELSGKPQLNLFSAYSLQSVYDLFAVCTQAGNHVIKKLWEVVWVNLQCLIR